MEIQHAERKTAWIFVRKAYGCPIPPFNRTKICDKVSPAQIYVCLTVLSEAIEYAGIHLILLANKKVCELECTTLT